MSGQLRRGLHGAERRALVAVGVAGADVDAVVPVSAFAGAVGLQVDLDPFAVLGQRIEQRVVVSTSRR